MGRKLTVEDLKRIREESARWAKAPRVYKTMRCGHQDYVPDFINERENDCWVCRRDEGRIGLAAGE